MNRATQFIFRLKCIIKKCREHGLFKKVKKKIKNFVTANPKKTIVGVGLGAIYGHSKTPMARQSQNQRIEMQAIVKERKVAIKLKEKYDKKIRKTS